MSCSEASFRFLTQFNAPRYDARAIAALAEQMRVCDNYDKVSQEVFENVTPAEVQRTGNQCVDFLRDTTDNRHEIRFVCLDNMSWWHRLRYMVGWSLK